MPKNASNSLERLAARLESDIRSRGLSPGDPYLTAQQAADLTGLSQTLCHRALRLLADRDIVRRRRNSGTFVGPNIKPAETSLVRSIYVLSCVDRIPEKPLRDALMDELIHKMPGAGYHFALLPDGNEARYLEELQGKASSSGQLTGTIAISCRREVYRYLAAQSAPAVVIGAVEGAESKLPSVSGDLRHAGRQLAQHLLGRGYRRFAACMREVWRGGDNLFLEGIEEAMHDAGLPAAALRIRSLPHDRAFFREFMRPYLEQSVEPLALIFQSQVFVDWLDEMRSESPDDWPDLGIAYNSDLIVPDEATAYPTIYLEASAAEMTAIAVDMLARLCKGEELAEPHVVLPMKLFEPSRSKTRRKGKRPISLRRD